MRSMDYWSQRIRCCVDSSRPYGFPPICQEKDRTWIYLDNSSFFERHDIEIDQVPWKRSDCKIVCLDFSGKSTLACSVSRELYSRGKLSYVLDGDNLRHGLNKDLGFKAEDRTENIRRVGEVAKLFADAGLICIASLISPYRKDRDACRAMLQDKNFIEVFMNMPLEVCEARDSKGLYKLAREGKIKGFTGIDDPYEPPVNCEIEIGQKGGVCPPPGAMAGELVSYLEDQGYLQND